MGCECTQIGLANTGTPDCLPIQKVAKKQYLVPTKDSAGAKNFHDLTVNFDQAYLDGKVNATDASQRWYPLPDFENVGGERATSIIETAASGKKAKIRSGVRNLTAEMWSQSPFFLGQLEDMSCKEMSVFIVDTDGNFIGMKTDSTEKIYPIAIDKESFDPILLLASDTTIQKVNLNYDWKQSEKDRFLYMVTNEEITADIDNARGLIDVSSVNSAITTTTLTVELSYRYGAAKQYVKGLITTDFVLFNVTDSLVVAQTVTESSPGVYDFVFAAETSSDVIRITPSKDSWDFSAVVLNTAIIP